MTEDKSRVFGPSILVLLLISFANACYGQDHDRIDRFLKAFATQDFLNGVVLVGRDDSIIYEKPFGYANMEWKVKNTMDGRFRIGSMTKQFTAALILVLKQEGKLALDDTIAEHIPYYRKDTGNRITIHQLLAHTSGIPEYNNAPNFWQDSTHNHYILPEFIEKFGSGDPEFEPGSRYNYTNTEYLVLGAIIEQIEGKSYGEVLREKLLDPLELNQTGIDQYDARIEKRVTGYLKKEDGTYQRAPYYYMGNLHGAGAMYSTASDLFRWTAFLHNSDRILSPESRRLMMTPNLNGYGYGLSIKEITLEDGRGITYISHGGGVNGIFGQMEYYREGGYFILILDNAGNRYDYMGEIRNGLRNILYGFSAAEYLPRE